MKCRDCGYTIRREYKGNRYYCLACGAIQTCELCGAELDDIKMLDDIIVCPECFDAAVIERGLY